MITANDIMTKEIVTVSNDTSIKELSDLFVKHRVNGFPVLDNAGKLTGIVTEKNLIEKSKNLHIPTVIALFDAVIYLESGKKFEEEVKRYNATRVEDICSNEVITVSPETSVQEIATLMAEKGIHTIPVTRKNSLVGIIGKLDVIQGLARE